MYRKSNLYRDGKSAVIVAHFGTTHKDTKEKTIDKVNQKINDAFEGKADVFEAFTSRMIIKILEKREGIKKLNPSEILEDLKDKGYKNIIIQSTNIIDGIEMEAIKKEAEKYKKFYDLIRVGEPLLSTEERYEKTILGIKKEVGEIKEKQGVVLVGHGTHDSATSAYPMLDYMAKDMNLPFYVGTVEGYPTIKNVEKQLKRDGIEEVILMPLMFVAGDHAKNDIDGDWKEELEEMGYKVEVRLKPLGEMEDIQNIFIENAKFLEIYEKIDILDKKKGYSLEIED